jgi:hypothetical protein
VPAPNNSDRDRAIAAAARLGVSHDSLAAQYGLSRPRVSQIVKTLRPRTPGEAERAEVAATLRRKYDELQRIVDSGTPRSSAIGKVVVYPEGHERAGEIINDESVTIRAISEQAKLMTQYRAMFGVDITQPPAPLVDARSWTLYAEGRAEEKRRNQVTPAPPLAALPADYGDLAPDEQLRTWMDRKRAQVTAQQAAITAAPVVDAELVDE